MILQVGNSFLYSKTWKNLGLLVRTGLAASAFEKQLAHPGNSGNVKIDVLIGSPPLLYILIMKFRLSRLLIQLVVLAASMCVISYAFSKGFNVVGAT